MLWKIVLVLGILGTLLGLIVVVLMIGLVLGTNGRTSWDEALLGIIPGAIVMIFSFFVAVIGLIFVLKNRKKPQIQTQ